MTSAHRIGERVRIERLAEAMEAYLGLEGPSPARQCRPQSPEA